MEVKMKDWKKEILPWAGLLPVGVLAVCIASALSGYKPPVFTAEAAEEVVKVTPSEAPLKQVAATTTQDAVVETLVSEPEAKAYKDGTYYGSAEGFAGTMTVQVVIEDGKIKDIVLTETKDDQSYVQRASYLLSLMVEKQSTQVDAVSGATYSSVGLINAVRNALGQAALEGTTVEPVESLPPASTKTKPDADAKKTVEKVEEDSAYKDGTYTGTGTGFGGTIKVKVTIKNGKITKIKVTENSDDKEYMEAASALLKQIVKKQSTNVDTVSGATYSSVGLINAVRDALEKASVTKTDDTATADKEETQDTIPKGKFPYKDGIYYGTGVGFRDDITVAIVIKDKTLVYATVTDSVDDEAFLVKAETILDEMIQKQKTKVDVISGATYSSNGILEAVRNAMKEAKRVTKGTDQKTTDKKEDGQDTAVADSESTDTTEPSEQPSEQPTESGAPSADSATATEVPSTDSGNATEAPGTDAGVPVATASPAPSNTENAPAQNTTGTAGTTPTPATPAPSATEAPSTVYIDGTYTGTAVCYPDDDEEFDSYTLSLQITISNDVITSITNVKGSGTKYDSLNDSFITLAANGTAKKKGAIAQMVNKGVPSKVDAVSGATCSSDAILQAVKNAMANAKRK